MTAIQRPDVKTKPRSEVMRLWRPNLEIQLVMGAVTHDSVVPSITGISSSHWVELLFAVKRCQKACKGGRATTM